MKEGFALAPTFAPVKINPKFFIGLGLLLIVGYFLQDLVLSDSQYIIGIKKKRQEKDDSFRRVNGSPLSQAQRDTFKALPYYAPDRAYRLDAQYQGFTKRDTTRMATTGAQPEAYLRWGQATFILDKQEYKLTLYRRAFGPDTTLFIPFADRTNGLGSYGGGRYLDAAVPAPDDTEITLDFNHAYNPYCAYNNSFVCPLPPAENRLNVEIPAGEKAFHE